MSPRSLRAPTLRGGPIRGVRVRPLDVIRDGRGEVRHMLRSDDRWFKRFGEIYFSLVKPGKVKGWHLHARMTLNYAVPRGRIRLVLYDARPRSPTRGRVMTILTGEDRYRLVTVPPGVWNAFQGLGRLPSLVANCATLPHDPREITRRPPDWEGVPCRWRR